MSLQIVAHEALKGLLLAFREGFVEVVFYLRSYVVIWVLQGKRCEKLFSRGVRELVVVYGKYSVTIPLRKRLVLLGRQEAPNRKPVA